MMICLPRYTKMLVYLESQINHKNQGVGRLMLAVNLILQSRMTVSWSMSKPKINNIKGNILPQTNSIMNVIINQSQSALMIGKSMQSVELLIPLIRITIRYTNN